MSDFKPTLSEEERAAFRALYLALKPFWKTRTGIPVSYLMTFLAVGFDEGKGVAEYADIQEVSPTVMTRNLLDIGDRNRNREEGLGLITQERDLFDLRKHNARMTPKGKSLARHITTALKTFCREV
jgi:DNA-binding MarR family transcriptional regulator